MPPLMLEPPIKFLMPHAESGRMYAVVLKQEASGQVSGTARPLDDEKAVVRFVMREAEIRRALRLPVGQLVVLALYHRTDRHAAKGVALSQLLKP